MIQGFYSAVTGAQQQMRRMDVQANNISNVNTYGYKAQTPAFQTLMYGMLDGIDGAQLSRGSGVYMSATGTNWTSGPLRETGRSLDYAIVGDGYFALYDPGSGEVSFTRDGAFTMAAFQVADPESEQGVRTEYYLSDGEGRQVLGQDGYPVQVTDPEQELPVGVFDIQYQDGLQRDGSSRFLMGDKNGTVWLSTAKVQQGMLEESNADLATELGQVIEAQRSYSYALKMLQTADEVESTINGLPNG
ncbi:MAG: flagellar hook basal-body protein [Pseudoflavonifractor capillosus]|uniref:flagellar hook-basal body protein n=1 Tax=Pseudoflavonifractor capillosus TaxID=106588 RepID=UPI0023F9B810|nr:flagellar hook basal-body protein [Pseudoflavonifractor capillosus]MCI5928813.1 flagellar hook basal-body protein [Pseudoflavonifractor capillosus]MDY4660297.1 flagellar hook basal-body protein [Pseudoflavonifractor capillosus]